MQNIVILSVEMLNDVMLSVIAPFIRILWGAMTLSITALSLTTLSIKDTQHKGYPV